MCEFFAARLSLGLLYWKREPPAPAAAAALAAAISGIFRRDYRRASDLPGLRTAMTSLLFQVVDFQEMAVGQKEIPWGPQVLVYFSFYLYRVFLDTLFWPIAKSLKLLSVMQSQCFSHRSLFDNVSLATAITTYINRSWCVLTRTKPACLLHTEQNQLFLSLQSSICYSRWMWCWDCQKLIYFDWVHWVVWGLVSKLHTEKGLHVNQSSRTAES